MRKAFFTTTKIDINKRVIGFFKEWAWTIIWTLSIAICLEYALHTREKEYFELQQERISLEQQLQDALILNKRYLEEISSQTDPAWVELVLIKKLGLVPEGQKKFIFVRKT